VQLSDAPHYECTGDHFSMTIQYPMDDSRRRRRPSVYTPASHHPIWFLFYGCVDDWSHCGHFSPSTHDADGRLRQLTTSRATHAHDPGRMAELQVQNSSPCVLRQEESSQFMEFER